MKHFYSSLFFALFLSFGIASNSANALSILDKECDRTPIIAPPIQNSITLSLSVGSHAAEDNSIGFFTLTTDQVVPNAVIIDFTVSGTATVGSDYMSLGSTVVMPAGTDTLSIPVQVIADSGLEPTETVIITLTGTSDANVVLPANPTATLNITDNDNATVLLNDTGDDEDDGLITVSAMLTNAVQGGFTVEVSTQDGSATAVSGDYVPLLNHVLTFAGTAGEIQTFQVESLPDFDLEPDETIIVSLSNLQNTTLPVQINSTGIITLYDDDDCQGGGMPTMNLQTWDGDCANERPTLASAMLHFESFETATDPGTSYRSSTNNIPGLPQWSYTAGANTSFTIYDHPFFPTAHHMKYGLRLRGDSNTTQSAQFTVDLSNQVLQDDLKLGFYHGYGDGNLLSNVSVRGSNVDPWLVVENIPYTNRLREYMEVDLDSALTANRQDFSATTEIKFTFVNMDNSPTTKLFDQIMIFKENYTYLWSDGSRFPFREHLQPGTHSVTVTNPQGCSITQNFMIGGDASDDTSFMYPNTVYCTSDGIIDPIFLGVTNGNFFGIRLDEDEGDMRIDFNTGQIDIARSDPGNYLIVYFTSNNSNPCGGESFFYLDILPNEDPYFTYDNAQVNQHTFITDEPIQVPSNINTTGGTFSSTAGIDLDSVTGAIDPSNSTPGVYDVVYTTGGACSDSYTKIITILQADSIAPVASCQDISVSLDNSGIYTLLASDLDNGSSDNIGIVSMTLNQTAFTCQDLGSNTVTFTVTDAIGNQSSCDAVVTVIDNSDPIADLANLPDVTATCELTSLTAPTAQDNCSGLLTATSDTTLPLGLGSHTITWTYNDGNGNSILQTQQVIVSDDAAPVANCPQDIVEAISSGTTNFNLPDYTSSLAPVDDCVALQDISVVQDPAPGTAVAVPSSTAVTVTISDNNGNDLVCTFNVRTEVTASSESVEAFDLKIYPNPTKNELNVIAQDQVISQITLVDLSGRVIKVWEENQIINSKIDLSDMRASIYFLKVVSEKGTLTRRIVKK